MRDRTVFYLVGLTLLSVFVLWVGWEFVVEDVIWSQFWSEYGEESPQHHWEYVISATILAGIALIIPTLVSLRSIAAREGVEEALRASEERLRAVVDHSPGAIVIKDLEGRNLIANKLFCTWYGTTSEKIIGKSVYDFVAKESADRITAQEQKVIETGTVFEEERQVTYPDGVTRSVFTQKFPIFGADGDCLAVGNVITDLTERKKVEELLKIAVDNMPEGFAYFDADDRLAMVNSKIVDTYPMIPDLLVPGVSYETIVRTGVERGQFCPDDGQDKEEWIEERLAYHRDPKGSVDFNLPDGRCIRVEEVRTPEGGIVGVRADITDLKKIERQLREARDELELRVTERTKELAEEVAVRTRAEAVLRESEERYRRIYNNTPVMLHSVDRDGRLLSVSDHWLTVLGYGRGEVIGRTVMTFMTEESARHSIESARPAFAKTGRTTDLPLKFVKKNGEVIDVLLSSVAERKEEGKFVRSLTVLTDVTERKRAEERFRSYFDLPLVGSAIYSPDKRWTEVNDKLCDLLGYTRDELMALTWVDVTHPDDLAENLRLFDGALSGEGDNAYTMEKRFVRKDGETIHTSVSVQCVRRPDGAPDYFIVLIQDVTERKQAGEALGESRARLIDAIESISEGFILFDAEERLVLCNSKYREFYPMIADVLTPGRHLEDIVRATAESGQIIQAVDDVEGWIRERLIQYRSPHGTQEQHLSDGRWLVVSERRTREGGIVGVCTDFTERERAEEALRESEERLRAIVDSIVVGVITIDERGVVHSFNPGAKKIFGFEPDEVVGESITVLMAEPHRSGHDGYIANYLRTGAAQIIGKGREVEGRRKDGSIFPMELEIGEMVAGGRQMFTGIVTDITERKRAEAALRESEERFRAIAANVPGYVYRRILRPDGLVTWAYLSPGLHDLLELDPDEVMARPELLIRTLHPEDQAKWEETIRRSAETLESYVLEYRRITPSGKLKWMRTMARPHREENGDVVWDGVTLDITEEKEAQAQLIQASKLATLGEMASGIAHELNQPLSVVGMSAELSLMSMEGGKFDIEFVRRKLEKIVGQRDRMAEIIDHMRLFSRTDKARLESFNPVDAVTAGIRLIEQQFRAAGIELEMDCPADCRNVSGYPLQLEQVVLNLLTNARDAVLATMDPAGTGTGNPAPRVRVSLVDDKRRKTVVISVADNGSGIPEAALKRIFDPFFTTKTEGHGTGLGLSISYSIIDAMGGRLEAQDTEGGAVFRISLPVPANGAGAVNRGKGKTQKNRTQRPGAQLPRVLVVDDEEVIVEEVAEYLGRKGYEVATAGNGREALDVHQARPADVVVTDLFMPEMGGAELIRRLHKFDPDLPIVVVTGHTTFGDDRDIVAEGASVVLKKPIVLRELTDSLKELGRR